jgi:hypothetical protein
MKIQKFNYYFILAIYLSPFIYWLTIQLNQDIWWDEITSLKDYALVNFSTTVTTYPDPNNHILFNLINNLFTRVINIRDFYEILDYIYTLRILQAIFASITIYYSYLIVKKFFFKNYAPLAVAALTSTIPFLNFSLQLRGYNLSMMLLVTIIYHSWNYIDHKKTIDLIVLPLLIFSLLYTIPSNVYALLALSITILVDWKIRRNLFQNKLKLKKNKSRKQKQQSSVFQNIDRTFLLLVLVSLIGIVFCYVAYTPVMDDLLNNRFVNPEPKDRLLVLNTFLPDIFFSFLSARWLLLLLIPVSILIWRKTSITETPPNKYRLWYLIIIQLSPFFFLAIHNKIPFQRTFVVLVPIFALTISILIIEFIQRVKSNHKVLILFLLSVYMITTSFIEINHNNEQLNLNLTNEYREQNIYRNYYLSQNFKPHDIAQKITQINKTNSPVLMLDELDRVSLTFYFKKYDIESLGIVKLERKSTIIGNQNYSHQALIQKSNGKNKDIQYMNFSCNLPNTDRLNPYLLLLEMTNPTPPFQEFILLSSFPNRVKKIEAKMLNYEFEKTEPVGFAILRKVQKQR